MKIAVSQIRLDGGTQTRAEIDLVVANDYAEHLRSGVTFPPVVVFYDGSDHWLADGFHRVTAAKSAQLVEIDADVRQGTRRDAILFSVGANAAHGLRRTNADKRRAVETLLRDEEWSKWSDREIARRAGVHHEMVGKLRPASGGDRQMNPTRTVERNGVTYQQSTANIGRSLKSEAQHAQTERLSDAPAEKPPVSAPDEEDDLPDVVREPDVYTPEPTPLPRIDPPPRAGWGASELATFVTETVIACRDFQQSMRARFGRIDQRFSVEARERSEAVVSETIEALRELLPSSESTRPKLSIVKGGK